MSGGPSRRVTLADVAERAGVSRSAVSRSFTEGASIATETRRKVLTAAKELGYSPNILARSLTTRSTKLIGLTADNFANPVLLVMLNEFTRLIQDKGYVPLLINLSGETRPGPSIERLKQYAVDGVIVASSTLPTSFAVAFREAGLPVVHSFGRYAGESHAHVVGVDNVYCGQLAAETLLEHGYRRLGFLGGPETAISTKDRERGFCETLAESSIGVSVSYAAAYSYDAGYAEMARLIAEDALPEAFFCGDDLLAIGAIDALAEAGLKVPQDVGIIGMNDMDMTRWRSIGLTTIRQPVSAIIEASVDLLLASIAAPDAAPETRLLSCEVVLRNTLRR